MTTKAEIIQLLRTNDRAVARALVVLNERQTATEQVSESTINHNGEGFRPCNARMGTSMANFYLRNGYLTPKQVAYWRMPIKTGQMRIEVYAGQLHQIAKAKESAKWQQQQDVGNLAEQLMVAEEMYNSYLDSDDFPTLEKMAEDIARLKSQIQNLATVK